MTGEAERIPWDAQAPDRDATSRVQSALERGELVAIPTETVYGIAARADRADAIGRLCELKRRDPALPLTWHVGRVEALERFGRVSPLVARLAERYWPGPLTLVLPGVPPGLELAAQGGWTAVRLPAQRATADLLAALPFPVVATSANRHGEPPLADAGAVEAAFGRGLAFVLDGGRSRLGESSVVLKVGPGHFEILRAGLIDAAGLRQAAGLEIGFVCTGNTCRSPMAEGIARREVARRLEVPPERLAEFGFGFRSMGILAGSGTPASRHAIDVLADWDIDISAHRSRPAVPEEIRSLSSVYAMTSGHLESLRLMLPPGAVKHLALLDPEGRNIPDPIGGPRQDYERSGDMIRRAIAVRIDEWV